MIMLLESDAERLETLLRELYTFCQWPEAKELLARLELARRGYPSAANMVTQAVGIPKEPSGG